MARIPIDDQAVDSIEDQVMERLAKNVKRLRAERGLSVRDVERASSVGGGSISRIENKKVLPSIAIVVRLAVAFGVDLRKLLQ